MELHHTLCQRENGLWGDGSMGKVLAVNTRFLSMNLENPYGRAGHGNTQCSYREMKGRVGGIQEMTDQLVCQMRLQTPRNSFSNKVDDQAQHPVLSSVVL